MLNIYFTRHAKNRMRWRKISSKIVNLVLEKPDKIEDKGENNFEYYKNIEGIIYKVFCVVSDNKFVIKSAIKK
jgi:hypothetical protein